MLPYNEQNTKAILGDCILKITNRAQVPWKLEPIFKSRKSLSKKYKFCAQVYIDTKYVENHANKYIYLWATQKRQICGSRIDVLCVIADPCNCFYARVHLDIYV